MIGFTTSKANIPDVLSARDMKNTWLIDTEGSIYTDGKQVGLHPGISLPPKTTVSITWTAAGIQLLRNGDEAVNWSSSGPDTWSWKDQGVVPRYYTPGIDVNPPAKPWCSPPAPPLWVVVDRGNMRTVTVV